MNLFFVFVLILAVIQIVKEVLEKPAPKGTRFDWDAYWKDIENGIDPMEQVRKCERGDYRTTKPLPDNVMSTNNKNAKNN